MTDVPSLLEQVRTVLINNNTPEENIEQVLLSLEPVMEELLQKKAEQSERRDYSSVITAVESSETPQRLDF